MERQVARELRAQSRKRDAKGDQVVTHQSFEDPKNPDIVHSIIVTVKIFIEENSPSGINQRQLSYSVIVFIYTYWEADIRPRLAKASGEEEKNITSDIMGDLRCRVAQKANSTEGLFRHR